MSDLATELRELSERFSEFGDVEPADAALNLEVVQTRALLMIAHELHALNETLQYRGPP